MAAKDTDLHDLHADLAKSLREKLANPEITAAELNVIRQFLKDNLISATPEASPDLAELSKKLPKFDDPLETFE